MRPTAAGSNSRGGEKSGGAWRRGLWLGVWLALLCGPGCRSGERQIESASTVRVDIESSPTALDPRFATDAISSRIDELIFDSLVRLDEQFRLVGDAAETIERPSPTELLFHLRHGLHFSDGRPLTARDVKYSYDSALDPATLSPKRSVFEPLAAIEALDTYTVRMTTREPYAAVQELAMLGIVPAGSEAHGAESSHPLGSGPFRLKKFNRDEAVVLERNPARAYPEGAPRTIVFRVVPDATVRVLELAKGEADFAENNLQPDLLDYLRLKPGLQVEQTPGTTFQYLAFNFHDSRLRDVRVRRAIAMAIDRDAIVNALLQHTARVASGMLSLENWAYQSDVVSYRHDPAAARKLLDEAGYPDPDGDGPRMRFKLIYKTTPEEERRRLAQAFQAMLARVGIGLEIRTNEWATFYSDIQHGNFDLTSLAWIGISDPNLYFMVFDSRMAPPRGLNRGYYSNPQMDTLVEAGRRALEQEERRRLYAQVQRLAAEQLPYLPLWWSDNVAVMSRRLSGFKPYPNGSLISLATLRLEEAGEAAGGGE